MFVQSELPDFLLPAKVTPNRLALYGGIVHTDHMAKISLLVSDADLDLIDSVSSNRSAFMSAASREAAKRVLREREDEEIGRICRAMAERDHALASEFGATVADGIA